MSGRTFDFGDFFYELNAVKGVGDFIQFFQYQSTPVQVVMGIVMLGILVLVWIFVVALLVDKHI